MIKVTALTSGRHHPSSRFRVRQFIEPLRNFEIDVCERYPIVNKYYTMRLPAAGMLTRLPGVSAARKADVTWLGRELIPGRSSLERFTGRRKLIDIDDAIWLNAPHFSEKLALLCDGVIAGNSFIADYFRALGARVWTIPTSLDTSHWRPLESRSSGRWRIGWTGTSSNLQYLYSIQEPLADFLAQHQEAELLVICNRRPSLKKLPAASWQFMKWTPENEVTGVQSFDVGLMPLMDNDWGRGKCALKMLMYLAVGIPAIASPVGVSKDLLDRGNVGLAAADSSQWFGALERLFCEREFAAELGKEGRRLVEDEYSVRTNVSKIAAAIQEVAAL